MEPLDGSVSLVDSFGRVVRKLRISVTDRCNFRCVYCMPEDVTWLPKGEILSFEEIERVAGICVAMGVEKIRLTGGEPLVRRGIADLTARLARLDGLRALSMTTNAYYLPEHATALKASGLDSLNISLDTLRRDRFERLARRDYYDQVIRGIEAAADAGFPIKINTVVMRGFNDDEVAAFARWGRETGFTVRFIEFMPLDGDHIWNERLVMPASEILDAASSVAPLEPVDNDPREPARLYRFSDDGTHIGVIASVTRPFCSACDRIRLTADGKIRNCLFAVDETDLKPVLRGGGSDADVAAAIRRDIAAKWEGHLINRPGFKQPDRAMHAIGG